MQNFNVVLSPLDQFEIRDLLSINASILGNSQISVSNIGLYLCVGTFIITLFSLLATNYNRLIPNA
jgi:F0F1-type ATP synthase membrane subunit a